MSKRNVVNKSAKPRPWIWGVAAIGVIAVVALIWSSMSAPAQPASALDRSISVTQAADLRDDGAFILDVRTPEEWTEVHIPDSTLIPLDQLSSRISEVPTDQPVVVVCRSGNRSASGRDILLQAGLTQVTSMDGGVSEWRTQGYPVTSGP